jgi:hypothetical protein
MNKSQQIDFESATYEEFKDYFIDDLLVNKRPELFSIITSHLFIENALESLIKKNAKSPNKILNNSNLKFRNKLDIVEGFGIFSAEFYYSSAKRLNDIRNKYAHKSDYRIKIDDLNAFRFNLTKNQDDIYKIESKKGDELAVNTTMLFLVATFYKFLSSEESKVINKVAK